MEEHELEEQIAGFLSTIAIPSRWVHLLLGMMEKLREEQAALQSAVVESKTKALSDCAKRLENLVRLKTSPDNHDSSLLSDEEYGRQRHALLAEKSRLEGGSSDKLAPSGETLNTCEALLNFAGCVREQFKNGNARAKKEVLQATCSNLILKDKKLFVEALEPFNLLQKSQTHWSMRFPTFEPTNGGSTKGLSVDFLREMPTRLAFREDVRTNKRKLKKLATAMYTFILESPQFHLPALEILPKLIITPSS